MPGFCRYERSKGRPRVGSALVQRHVALPEDIANKEGAGLMVSILALPVVHTKNET